MIVDCHTHVWESSSQMGLGPGRLGLAHRGPGAQATPGRHAQASQPVDVSLVLGFRSLALGAHVGAPFVASYVRQHPDRLVGFAGLDPTDLNQAMDEMLEAQSELGLGGVTVSPAVQQIHPAHTRAMQLYAEATRLALPVIFDDAAHRMVGGRMEFARPVLLDEIAAALPNLRMVVAHMGYPWVEETVVLLSRHDNVLADVSGLLRQPWQAYNALLSAHQHGVIDKVLFGSDFPYGSATAAIETLYSINQMSHGTNLPSIPRQELRGIVERDSLALLGVAMATPPGAAGHAEPQPVADHE